MNLADKKLIFVTGKGGVGKSALAAAIALKEARTGRRVCLAELGHESFYESFFETRGITYEPSEVIPQVHISLLSPEECLREYILHFLKVPKLYEIFFQNKVMKAFINAAPALPELTILGKLTSEIRGVFPSDYEVWVVDCFSTGHAMALLRAPRGLSETFKVGPFNEQAKGIDSVISDPSIVKFILATLPEDLPVNETIELYEQLKTEFNADVSVICNQVSESGLSSAEKKQLDGEVKNSDAREFLQYITSKEERQKKYLQKLKEKFGSFVAMPLILKKSTGQELIDAMIPSLEKMWDSTNS